MLAYITKQFGGSEGSQIQEINQPQCRPNGVIVKVHYASINPIDWKTRKGLGWGAESIKQKLPWVLGKDFSGEISEVGEAVSHLWSVGDKVCGCQDFALHGGAFAQYIFCHSSDLSKLPNEIDLAKAAALPLAGLTAWQALASLKIKDGEKVLIIGGAGGVGHMAIPLAIKLGANVYATCSKSKKAFVESLGATALDYQNSDTLSQHQQSFDAILDTVGGATGLSALTLLKTSARLVTLPTITANDIIAKATENKQNAWGILLNTDAIQLQGLLQSVADNTLKIQIEKTYAFDAIAEAFSCSEQGRVTGKLLIQLP